MSGKNAKENREKYLAEYDDQINKNFPGNDLDEEAKKYSVFYAVISDV